jgi:hypothetical protein
MEQWDVTNVWGCKAGILEDNPGIFNVQVFQKNPNAIPELKTAIQSETEATCTDTLSKVRIILFA